MDDLFRSVVRIAKRLPAVRRVQVALTAAANKRTASNFVREPNAGIVRAFRMGEMPRLKAATSQLCTANQFFEPEYLQWCYDIRSPHRLHRKQWEYVYILHALTEHGCIRPGFRGLGFGVGSEPMVSWFAAQGCKITATDQAANRRESTAWIATGQHASGLQSLNNRGICSSRILNENVEFRTCDMNSVPNDLREFDFVWSSCALEHLGSLQHGLDFIRASIQCLRPGGVAVHTTEFNLSSLSETVEAESCSVYRKRDIEEFIASCADEGVVSSPPNWQAISCPLDECVADSDDGGRASPHLRLVISGFVCTSLGLIFHKPR